ncbi:fungal-specific transcription factor domain-containing protein [Dactylonectria estremocensis]|uniref:Fungal-specific transcription factor domain-containing protein n=1 Tax=Dactylonectria estremocensis TaxID=1079267 RepID=A0A9P9FBA2_9HYPO|nr:fungal-specific transcription factor domain-containing protein [Dactylonectria estremocensis]
MSHRQNSKRQGSARSCEFCRKRKVRCDARKPACASCIRHEQECVYVLSTPEARPTRAIVNHLRVENERMRTYIKQLEESRNSASTVIPATEQLPLGQLPTGLVHAGRVSGRRESHIPPSAETESLDNSNASAPDVSPFLWTDEKGNLNVFGPSSALQSATRTHEPDDAVALVHVQNGLLANAVISRQREHLLRDIPSLDGVPIDLAIHLLEIHWNRQHHSFLLTYRPVIMRDILQEGRFSSKFLLNAIFACASKFSQRAEVVDDSGDLTTSGGRFFRRCDELMASDNLLLTPSLPTVVGLLLLGSTFNARGITSKAWLLTGYALRMVFDVGLHLNHRITQENAMEVEMYRRVFWGAFICDKLQSLYLGRPVAIKLRDVHVSHEFNDMMEEDELCTPYVDPTLPLAERTHHHTTTPRDVIHSVTCFQQLCLLFKIVAKIIDNFYVVGATAAHAYSSLQQLENDLENWEASLPECLRVDPTTGTVVSGRTAAPNLLILHITFNGVVILLHRPLTAGGHLKMESTVPAMSWKRCSDAATKITHLSVAYRSIYSLRAAPYLISYGLYVACTIHVRNAAVVRAGHAKLLAWSLRCLEELSVPNPGVSQPVTIIKNLMLEKEVEVSESILQVNNTSDSSALADTWTSEDAATVETFDFQVPLSNLWTETAELNWDDWQETYNDDVLFGFMDGQSNLLP